MTEATRMTTPEAWGRVVLEEVLFLAASQLSADGDNNGDVHVRLEFSIVADMDADALVITAVGRDGTPIVTTLPRPF